MLTKKLSEPIIMKSKYLYVYEEDCLQISDLIKPKILNLKHAQKIMH